LTAVLGLITATQLLAQAPAPQQPTPSEQKVVVTGCLRAAPSPSPATAGTSGTTAAPGATGTTGVAGAPAAPAADATAEQKFVLADATAASDPSAKSPEAAPDKQTYKLIANTSALAPHTDKKLELTGTIEPPNAGQAHEQASSGTTLRVTSGRVIAASCDEK